MDESGEALKLIAENYGLPGMVLFLAALIIGVIVLVIMKGPAWIKAIRGDKDRSGSTPTPARNSKDTRQWTQEEIRAAKGDVEKLVDLKLAPMLLRIGTLETELAAAKKRDGEHYGLIRTNADGIGNLETQVGQIRTAVRAGSGEGSGLTQHDG